MIFPLITYYMPSSEALTMPKIETVLFDLDGTLLDTAPDMTAALNCLRRERSMADLPLADVRPLVGQGVKALLKLGFNVDDQHRDYAHMLHQYFTAYQNCFTSSTALFQGMLPVLDHLEARNIPWGIVTNKPTRFTTSLLDALDLTRRSGCTICGDTLSLRKPHPEPILHACKLLMANPATTVYIGDAITDMMASKAAGTFSLAALYGYIGAEEDPYSWQADGYINSPSEIISWLE